MAQSFRIALYTDSANVDELIKYYRDGKVRGFTTNPSLMAKAGVRDYADFAKSVVAVIRDLPISFEVIADEFSEMERQAKIIHSWGSNVNVKIPITNTQGESSLPLIKRLFAAGVKLNVTAILTQRQLDDLRQVLQPQDDVIVSIFAGRIADTGVDPIPVIRKAVEDFRSLPNAKILWASPREVLNIYQAEECGCHIITVTPELLQKLKLKDKSLTDFSRETVQMFYDDAKNARLAL